MSDRSDFERLTKVFMVSGLAFIIVVLLIYGAGVLVPFAIGLLLWFLINAIAQGFQRLSFGMITMPRPLAPEPTYRGRCFTTSPADLDRPRCESYGNMI